MRNNLLLLFTIFSNTLLFAQNEGSFKEISDYELETRVIHNIKEGMQGYYGIYTHIVFEMEDYFLLVENFEFLSTELNTIFNTEEFYLDDIESRLIVTFEKSKSSTDDFLKIFKETMKIKNVFMHLYEENILVKN